MSTCYISPLCWHKKLHLRWINIPRTHIFSTKRLTILHFFPQGAVVEGRTVVDLYSIYKKKVSRLTWMQRTCVWQRLDFTVRHEVRKSGHLWGGLSSVSNKTPAVFSVCQAAVCRCWAVREYELILCVLRSFELLCEEYFQCFLNTCFSCRQEASQPRPALGPAADSDW